MQALVVAQIVGINTNIDSAYQISVGGGVQSTFYNATSDERLKTNIETLSQSLQQIEQLRGVSYNWKHEPELGVQYGLIAQELEQVIPEAVSNSNLNNKYGFETKNINYFALIPFLVESIKTLSQENEELEDDVALLEHALYKLNNK